MHPGPASTTFISLRQHTCSDSPQHLEPRCSCITPKAISNQGEYKKENSTRTIKTRVDDSKKKNKGHESQCAYVAYQETVHLRPALPGPAVAGLRAAVTGFLNQEIPAWRLWRSPLSLATTKLETIRHAGHVTGRYTRIQAT